MAARRQTDQRLLASLPGSGGQSISLRSMSSQGERRRIPTDLAPLTRAAPLMTTGLFFKNVKLTSRWLAASRRYRSVTPLLNLNHFTMPCRRSIGDKAHDGDARLLLLILVILTIVSLITLLSAPAFP